MIQCKSVYEQSHPGDGDRILVDRLWPEGLTTKDAAVTEWLREIAPSYELWRHNYDLARWDDYRRKYLLELASPEKRRSIDALREKAASGTVTLLYGTSDRRRNNAEIVKKFIEANQPH